MSFSKYTMNAILFVNLPIFQNLILYALVQAANKLKPKVNIEYLCLRIE